jgi:hypothetical protein
LDLIGFVVMIAKLISFLILLDNGRDVK